jgi:glycosyltransferase involved in cell wall biosynthesis
MPTPAFQPLVSIVIPVYNGSRYLAQAINSALAQTYKNIEILVVNDGSNDGGKSRGVALAYGDKIRYFEKENGGVSTALNLAIANMRGEYFSWLSHDDLYLPDKIQIQIDILQKEEHKDAIIYGNYVNIDENSQVLSTFNAGAAYPKEKLAHSLYPLLRGLIHGCSLLIHKSHFERVGLFDEKLRTAGDYDLWFKMFRSAKLIYHDGTLVKNRCHAEQQVNYSKTHVAECNWLWSSMIDRLTSKELREMAGSEYQFYRMTAAFLKETPFTEAQQHVQALADNVREKISVIIPFYNRIPLVLEAIISVLNQTYENFEILLIDDGSTDNPAPIKKFASSDSRIRYFRREHAGVSSARNFGISQSSGDYVAFLDSDDMFLPNKLEKQLSFMKAHDLYFSHTSYTRVDSHGKPLQIIDTGAMSGEVFPRILANCVIATPTVMARREVLERRRFKEEIGIGEDVCLWIDISCDYSIGAIRESLTNVRLGKTTAALSTECQKLGYFNILQHILKNPKYSSQEYYIHLLLKDYANVFHPEPAPSVLALSGAPVCAKGFFRRRFRVIDWGVRLAVSLKNVGIIETYFKICRKVRSKFMPQALNGMATTPLGEIYSHQ